MDIDEKILTETPAGETFDRDALEASVSKGLEALVDPDVEPVELVPTETEPTKTEPVATEPVKTEPLEAEPVTVEPVATEPTETEPVTVEPTGEVSKDEPAKEQQPDPENLAPTFPEAYRRTLHAYDWTDDEIANALNQEPDARASFMVTAQKLHANRNAELAKWAEMGRRQRDVPADSTATPAKELVKPTVEPEAEAFAPANIDALIEKHGNEDLVREIAEPFNRMMEQINEVLPDLMSGVQSIRESRQQALSRQIDQFFGSEGLKSYAEVYGLDSTDLSDDQVGTRNKVLEFADALVAGASLQGRRLSTEEALVLAHDSVSGEFKEKAIRTEIRKSVTVRSKGLSLKPTGKTTQKAGPKTREELERDVHARLASVFSS